MMTRRSVPILWTVFFVLAAAGFVFGMWSLTQRTASIPREVGEEEQGEEVAAFVDEPPSFDQLTFVSDAYICIRGSDGGNRPAASCSTSDGKEVARIETVQNNPELNPEVIDAVAFAWSGDTGAEIVVPKFWTDTDPLSCTIDAVSGVGSDLVASFSCFTGDPNGPTEKRTYRVAFGDAKPKLELACVTTLLSTEGDDPVVTRSMTECTHYN